MAEEGGFAAGMCVTKLRQGTLADVEVEEVGLDPRLVPAQSLKCRQGDGSPEGGLGEFGDGCWVRNILPPCRRNGHP